YYGMALSFPNLGRPGSLGGLVVGRQPYLGGLDIEGGLDTGLRTDDSWHFEAFYKYQVNDNISITPGVIWVTNPNQNEDNDDTVIGTLRTTFQF
ncbi:MAG: carbohydrate porin, partial [Microcoleaceae cyanobacterium]